MSTQSAMFVLKKKTDLWWCYDDVFHSDTSFRSLELWTDVYNTLHFWFHCHYKHTLFVLGFLFLLYISIFCSSSHTAISLFILSSPYITTISPSTSLLWNPTPPPDPSTPCYISFSLRSSFLFLSQCLQQESHGCPLQTDTLQFVLQLVLQVSEPHRRVNQNHCEEAKERAHKFTKQLI